MTLPRRRGLALTIVGAVLMVLVAPASAGVGVWQGVSHGMSAVNGQPWVAPGGSVRVTGHESRTILVEGSYSDAQPLPKCRVTGPGGGPVRVTTAGARFSVDWGGTALTRTGTFSPATGGSYTVDCAGLRTKVLASGTANDITGRVLVPIGIGVGLGALVFVAGAVLLIIGIVKLVRSSRERGAARLAAAGGRPGPYGEGPTAYGPPR